MVAVQNAGGGQPWRPASSVWRRSRRAQPAKEEEIFILFADDVPVGTARFVEHDLAVTPRPYLGTRERPRDAAVPWLGTQRDARETR
jgi:hypothetical protein